MSSNKPRTARRQLVDALIPETEALLFSHQDGAGGAYTALGLLDAFEFLESEGWKFTPPETTP